MILGCYTLDLYCDAAGCKTNRFYGAGGGNYNPIQFTGRSERECRKHAKRDGWVLRGEVALCPSHAKAKTAGEPVEIVKP